MANTADRPDLEMLAMLYVARGWFVDTDGAQAYPAPTLAAALRIAEVRRGNRVLGIRSRDGSFCLSTQQILRLLDRRSRGEGR